MNIDQAIDDVKHMYGRLQNGDQYLYDLPAIINAIAEAKAVVDKLPRTKDGVPIVPDESVWAINGDGLAREAYIDPTIWPRAGYRTRSWKSEGTYSTREAALAAQKGGGE